MDDVSALAMLAASSFSAKFGHLYPPDVLASYLRDTYSTQATAALLAEAGRETWLAVGENGLQGFIMLAPAKLPHPNVTPGCVELRRLYTAPDATGRGIGARLMDQVALPFFARAGGNAWVGVYSGNAGAQRFYARYGFVKAGEYEFPVGPVRDREFILVRRRRG